MTANDSRSVSELFGDALSQFSKLVRNELQLARAEISMKIGQTTTAIGLLAGAAVFLIPALVLLLMSLATWLVEIGIRSSLAHLIAGLVGLSVVALLGAIGSNRLKTNSLVPQRTLDQFQQDTAAVREHV
jgi:uncharacterized membrane protein YqjE